VAAAVGHGLAGTHVLFAALLGTNVGGLRDRITGRASLALASVAVLPCKNLTGDPEQNFSQMA